MVFLIIQMLSLEASKLVCVYVWECGTEISMVPVRSC